jgi:hypothetical protein
MHSQIPHIKYIKVRPPFSLLENWPAKSISFLLHESYAVAEAQEQSPKTSMSTYSFSRPLTKVAGTRRVGYAKACRCIF